MTDNILYQFPRGHWGIANESPFCMKLECYLRMTKTPYTIEEINNPKKAPNGKVPFFSFQGEQLTDSGHTIFWLEKHLENPLDNQLNDAQKAQSLLVQRTLEEHLYWAIVYSRWIDRKGFKLFTTPYLKLFPFPINHAIVFMIKREVTKELWYQGLGRHSEKTMYQMCVDDLAAVVKQLDDKPYFFGDKPSSIDACIYAHFSSILYQPWETPLINYLREQQHAITYCERMSKEYFSFLPSIKPYQE